MVFPHIVVARGRCAGKAVAKGIGMNGMAIILSRYRLFGLSPAPARLRACAAVINTDAGGQRWSRRCTTGQGGALCRDLRATARGMRRTGCLLRSAVRRTRPPLTAIARSRSENRSEREEDAMHPSHDTRSHESLHAELHSWPFTRTHQQPSKASHERLPHRPCRDYEPGGHHRASIQCVDGSTVDSIASHGCLSATARA